MEESGPYHQVAEIVADAATADAAAVAVIDDPVKQLLNRNMKTSYKNAVAGIAGSSSKLNHSKTQLTYGSKGDVIKALEEWTSNNLKKVSENIPEEFKDSNNKLLEKITMKECYTQFNTAMLAAVLEVEKIMTEKKLQNVPLEDAETDDTTLTEEINDAVSDASSTKTTTCSAVTTAENRNAGYYASLQLQELKGFPEMANDPDVIALEKQFIQNNPNRTTINTTWLEKKSLFRYASSQYIDRKAVISAVDNKRKSINLYARSFEINKETRRSWIEGWGKIRTVIIDKKIKLQQQALGDPADDWKDLTIEGSFAGAKLGIRGMVACLWKSIRRGLTKWKTLYFQTNRTVILSELCINSYLSKYNNDEKKLAEAMENIAFNHKLVHDRENYIVIGSYAGNGLANVAVYAITDDKSIWPMIFISDLPTGLVRTIELEQGFKIRKDADKLRYNWQTYGDSWKTAAAIIPAIIWKMDDKYKCNFDKRLEGDTCWDSVLAPRHYKSDNDNRHIVGSAISILALMHMADTNPIGYTTSTYIIKKGLMNSHSDYSNRICMRRCGYIANREGGASHGGSWCRVAVSTYKSQIDIGELCAWGISEQI